MSLQVLIKLFLFFIAMFRKMNERNFYVDLLENIYS